MRLKRVRIFGFKTFADRTEFDLDGGIIAVVGPNGCGKSNLVDAILWGLGEGNSRQLRAQTSQDVIFSGSSRRKGVGFAEVVLLFDNEDGALPIDSPEVTITRRLNRAGESEYAINKQSCRLRDIYDLLADSGLGRSGYAIVGQKEIDAALSASADDRRGWIDEAAGVQRYRQRKQESLRRLNSAQEHLARVTDILNELEAQREPLREEAEVAARYKALSTTLQGIEVGMLIRDISEAITEIETLEKRIIDSTRLAAAEEALALDLERKAKAIGGEIAKVEDELDSFRTLQQGNLTAVERADSEIRLGQQKLESFDELERTLGEDSQSTAQRIDEAALEISTLETELQSESTAFEDLKRQLAGSDEEAKTLSSRLKAIDTSLAEGRAAAMRKMKAEAESEHRITRMRQAKRELSDIDRTLPDLIQAITDAEQAVAAAKAPLDEQEQKLKDFELALQKLRQEDDADARAVRESLAQRSALEGRKRGIEATIEAHEGLSQGARAVLEAVERGQISGDYRPVAEAIETDKDLALAIETALGGSANDLIVDDERDAKRAIDWLKQNRAGRSTFQPISLMRPTNPSSELLRLAQERGVVGRASELVDCEGRVRPVIDSLLGRILIVETLDDGLRIAKTSGWSRLVSLDGEVVHSSGAVTGGQTGKVGYGFVQRRADLTEIEAELASLNKLVAEHDRRVRQRADRAESITNSQSVARNAVLDLRDELADAQSFLSTLLDEKKSADRSRAKLETEIEQMTQAGVEDIPDIDIAAIEAERDQVMKVLAARSADAEQAETRLRESETRLKQTTARLDTARRRRDFALSSDEMRKKRIANLDPERATVKAEIEVQEKHRTDALQRKTDLEAKLAKTQAARRDLLEQSMRLSEESKAARTNAAAVSESLHQAEIARTRLEAKRANVAQRLIEEYSITETDALAQVNIHEVPDDAATIVSRLRREMRAMGDVNLGAIEAFERVSVRHDELAAQRDDVLQGIDQVQSSIAELDKMTMGRFKSTFEAVAEAFTALFARLFGGGEGRLTLSDPANILDSGVDLEITLPGKRRQPLNLLSGGERSLCASAFLFALLQVKPSPLVVLDEVDAPLDGRNVERFASLLTDFVGKSQFIVITHNPATIESAPIWLGVTMQEPGVSTLIPARLPGEKTSVYVNSAVAQPSNPKPSQSELEMS